MKSKPQFYGEIINVGKAGTRKPWPSIVGIVLVLVFGTPKFAPFCLVKIFVGQKARPFKKFIYVGYNPFTCTYVRVQQKNLIA